METRVGVEAQLYSFLTTTLDRSRQLHATTALPLRNNPQDMEYEAGRSPYPVWMFWTRKNSSPLLGIFQPVAHNIASAI